MNKKLASIGILAVLVLGGWAATANAQISIASADKKMTLNLGFLSQLQYEALDTANTEHTGQNLFFRRLRLMAGGKINDNLTYFFETDSPNLGKGNANGVKTAATIYFQDFVLTYSFGDAFKLDGGMLLIPVSHNSGQSAASLLAMDYGPYSFLHSAPLDSNVGRDYGLQARGYLGNNHFEYRFAVLQGNRGTDSTMPMRTFARVVWYPFEADNGFFYTGTTLGKKHVLAFGASYDAQKDYKAYGGDVYLDQPIAGGDALTAQVDYTRLDGGTTFTSLPKADNWLVEGGYFFHGAKIEPYVQYGKHSYVNSSLANDSKIGGGIIWWENGHKFNLKLFVGKIKKDGVKDHNQVALQWQLLTF